MVQATQRMEVPARLQREQGAGGTSKASPSPSLLSLPPATPSANALDTPMSEKGLAEVEASSGDHDGKEQAENEDDEDTASLPLWAQRQLSIRRQSLIPRNELDFVTGTGILPPPSTDLVIPGGARIKAYPPLLSDIVKVQREELLQEEAARHAEEEAEMAASAANNGKRRKASSAGQGKGSRGSFSAQGAQHEDDSEDTLGQLGQHQDQVDMGSIRTRRSSHAAQGTADEAHSSVKDGSERPTGARYNRRRTYGADDNEAYYPSGSSPTMGHGDEPRSYHSTTRPMRLDSPAELSIDMLDESTATGRHSSKGKNKHGKTVRQTVGASSSGYHNEDPREHSWDESRDTDMDRHQHQFYHHQGEHLDEESHATMRRASIHGLQEKGKVVKKTIVKSTMPKKVDLRASFGDMNEIEEEGEYGRRHSFQQIREHSQAGYGMMSAASPEADMARQRSDHGFGAFRTLQPLLNATQYDDHRGNQPMDHGSGERRFLLPPMGATRGYGNNQMIIPRVDDKKVKYSGAVVASAGTKGSKKTGAAHMGGHPGDVKRGRAGKAGEARRSILYGPSAESLAMAEALMEMHHDGAVDDHDEDEDATEDEYVPHRSTGADYAYSDSQDESHAAMRPSNVKKGSAQKRKLSAKMSTPTGATSGFGTMSPQPKKKKVANSDSAKSKKQSKDQGASTSSAGRQGGSSSSSFDSTGHRVSSLGSGSSSKHCEACGAKETPCWRPGYIPNTVLCNSCGLRYKKSNVFCTKVTCKYIPLKTEYANMEADRLENRRDHLICIQCKGRVALPIPKEEAA
ncbi:DNA-binding transcription repressor [Mortierella sp. NVP85]|nr:DNA-binding transcription repressor [Mortierella sp. NVP85]